MPSRTLSFESLERRELLTTAADIAWGAHPLSEEHPSATLAVNMSIPTFSLDFALPDGSRFARGLQNGTVEIYDTATGALLHAIPGQGFYASDISVSPDGRLLTVGTGKPSVRVFDATTYEEIGSFDTHGFTYPAAFLGNDIYSSTWEDKPTTVYNLETRTTRTIGGGSGRINYLTALRGRLYAFDCNGTLKEIDPQTGSAIRSIGMPPSLPLVSSERAGIIAMGTANGDVLLFDPELRQIGSINLGTGLIEHIGFDASGTKMIARSRTEIMYLEISDGVITETRREPAGWAGRYEVGLPVLPDGTGALVREEGRITAVATGWEAPPPAPEPDPVEEAIDEVIDDIAEELQQVMESSDEESAPTRTEPIFPLTAANIAWGGSRLSAENLSAVLPANYAIPTFTLGFALPDGSRIARGLQNGNVEIYDTATGALIYTIPGRGTYASQIDVSPDGEILAIGTGGNPGVRLFDARTYAEIGGFDTGGFVYPLQFIGEEIFSGTWEDKPVTVYDRETRAVRTIAGGANQANYLATIDDRLYAYDYRGMLKELDPQSGAVLRSASVPQGMVPVASAASNLIAVPTAAGRVHFFDPDLRPLSTFTPSIGGADGVAFDALGTTMIVRSRARAAFVDVSSVPQGGAATEAGTANGGASDRYDQTPLLLPDGTAGVLRSETSVTIVKTPFEAPVREITDDALGDLQASLALPDEVGELVAEAVTALDDDTAWRSPELCEVGTIPLPKGTHLNLREAEGSVIGLRSNVYSTLPVTAHVYRGTTLIASMAVPSDGGFSYEHEDGFTDVLFAVAEETGVYVSGTEIRVDEDLPDPDAEALGIMNAQAYALARAQAIPQPNDWAYAAQRLLGGDTGRFLHRDSHQYTLIRMDVTEGGPTIFDVRAVRLRGLDNWNKEVSEFASIPDEFLRRIDDRTFLIAPGMPGVVVVRAGGALQGSSYTYQTVNGPSAEALIPPAAMSSATVRSEILVMNDQHRPEGVFSGVREVPSGSSPVFAREGHQANVEYQVRNSALAGGTVTADVYAGWYAGEPERGTLQNSFTFGLGGGDTRRISVNVTAPSKPADATSDRPIISLRLRLPDGSVAGSSKLGKEPKSETRVFAEDGTMRIVSREYTVREQARINERTGRALDELLRSSDSRLVAARNALGVDRVIELIARNTAEALALADRTQPEESADRVMAMLEEGTEQDVDDVLRDREGVGGSDDLPPEAQKLLERGMENDQHPEEAVSAATIIGARPRSSVYGETLSWTIPANHALSEHFAAFDVSTVTGRMITSGIMQMHSTTGNAHAQWETAFKIQVVTDIPAYMLMDVANAGSPIAVARTFKALLLKAQYAHLVSPSAAPSVPTIVMAETNKATYDNGDSEIRIRFDVAGTASGVQSVQVFDGETLLNGARGIGFITIPIINVPSRVPPTTAPLPEFVECSFTIRIVLEDGTVIERSVSNFKMDIHLPDVLWDPPTNNVLIPIGDYSKLPAGPEHDRENLILSQIIQNFPVDTDKNWINLLGSYAHHDPFSTHAVDLNFGTAADQEDRDAPIYSVAPGKVKRLYYTDNDEVNGVSILVLEHTLPDGSTWDSVYMHMPMKKHLESGTWNGQWDMTDSQGNVITTLSVGQEVNTAGVHIAATGKKGAGGDHVHFQAHTHGWYDSPAINLDGIFQALSNPITTTVSADGVSSYEVTFASELQEWVNRTDWVVAHIFTAGSSTNASGTIIMRAWEKNKSDVNLMTEIEWKKVDEITDSNNKRIPISKWVKKGSISFEGSIWNPLTQQWTSYSN